MVETKDEQANHTDAVLLHRLDDAPVAFGVALGLAAQLAPVVRIERLEADEELVHVRLARQSKQIREVGHHLL